MHSFIRSMIFYSNQFCDAPRIIAILEGYECNLINACQYHNKIAVLTGIRTNTHVLIEFMLKHQWNQSASVTISQHSTFADNFF